MTRQNGPNQPSEAFRNSLDALRRRHFEQCERQAREEVLKAAPKEVAPKTIESATSPEEDLREEERGVAPRPEPGRGGVPTRSTSEAPPSQEVRDPLELFGDERTRERSNKRRRRRSPDSRGRAGASSSSGLPQVFRGARPALAQCSQQQMTERTGALLRESLEEMRRYLHERDPLHNQARITPFMMLRLGSALQPSAGSHVKPFGRWEHVLVATALEDILAGQVDQGMNMLTQLSEKVETSLKASPEILFLSSSQCLGTFAHADSVQSLQGVRDQSMHGPRME